MEATGGFRSLAPYLWPIYGPWMAASLGMSVLLVALPIVLVDDGHGYAVAAVVAILGEEEAMAKLAALAPLLEAHPHTPHWYLAFVGTRPEGRGRGLASRLIAVVTDRCDAEGIPAYLESSDPANVPLYERHGFAVTGEVDIEGGPTIPLMWREPRG